MTPAGGTGQGAGRRRVAGERGRGRSEDVGRAGRASSPPSLEKRPAPTAPARTGGPSLVEPAARPAPVVPPRARPGSAEVWSHRGVPAPSGRRTGLLVAVALLALVVVLAAAVVLAVDRQQQRVADARSAALEQARTSAETVLSYSHRTLDEDFAAALALSTGQFEQDYERTSQRAVREVAIQTEAEVRADVVSAGVVSGTADRVVVLLFVDQTTVSNRLDRPQTDQNRVRLTMVRSTSDDGPAWLVEQVDAL